MLCVSAKVEALRGELRSQAQAELEVREVPPEEGGPLLQSLLELEESGSGSGKQAPGAGPAATMDYETHGTAAVWRAYMGEAVGAALAGAEAGEEEKEKEGHEVVEEGLRLIEAWEAAAGSAATNATVAGSLPGAGHGTMVR